MFSAFRLEFWNLTLIGGEVSSGVFCMTQILIKDILIKVGNYSRLRIPYILREIGYR